MLVLVLLVLVLVLVLRFAFFGAALSLAARACVVDVPSDAARRRCTNAAGDSGEKRCAVASLSLSGVSMAMTPVLWHSSPLLSLSMSSSSSRTMLSLWPVGRCADCVPLLLPLPLLLSALLLSAQVGEVVVVVVVVVRAQFPDCAAPSASLPRCCFSTGASGGSGGRTERHI